VTPQHKDTKQQDNLIDTSQGDKFVLLPTTYILKSHDHIDDATALTDKIKVPVEIVSSAILRTDKQDNPSFKTVHRSSSKNIVKASYYDDDKSKPMVFIKCIPTPKNPLARIIQYSNVNKDKTNYCIHLESKLKKDSTYKISQLTDSSKVSVKSTRSKNSCKRASSKRSVSCRKPKPEVIHHFLPDCKHPNLKIDILFFPKDPPSPITDRYKSDSFHPFEIPSSLKKLSRKQISPSNCHSVRSATKDVYSDFFPTKILALDAKSSSIEKCMIQKHLPSKQIQRTEVAQIEFAKPDKAPACQKLAVASKRPCLTPEISGYTSDLPTSQELFRRYGKDIPIYQLEKYETCRLKRNGLQDECIPPLIQAILRREEQQGVLDKCSKGKQNVDQKRMGESMIQLNFCI